MYVREDEISKDEAGNLPEPVTRATFPSRREVSIADIVIVLVDWVGKGGRSSDRSEWLVKK